MFLMRSRMAPRFAIITWYRGSSRINVCKDERVTGVTYFDADGREAEQKARAIVVYGYAIETPRLLLNSACPGHEDALANSSGTLGRYLMAQAGNVVLGRFEELVRMYKAPPAHALTEEFYETDPERDLLAGSPFKLSVHCRSRSLGK
jgi:choline dehydrogenase-like flavoprotein